MPMYRINRKGGTFVWHDEQYDLEIELPLCFGRVVPQGNVTDRSCLV